jgi:hypothetical protein
MKKIGYTGVILTGLLMAGSALSGVGMLDAQQQHSLKPAAGFVPDEVTARAIAEAVSLPIYGKVLIDSEKPLKATLNNDVWTVTGTLPAGRLGGVLEMEIAREDARILRVSHGR